MNLFFFDIRGTVRTPTLLSKIVIVSPLFFFHFSVFSSQVALVGIMLLHPRDGEWGIISPVIIRQIDV
jgi:hypothetical protein